MSYKYGPVARNWYMNQVGARDDLRQQFIQREVYYVIGSDEASCACDPNSTCGSTGRSNCAALDCSPEAQAQGNNRHERAHNFYQSLDAFYSGHNHKLYEIQGIGHTSRIYFCGDTPKAIFGSWARADGC